MPPLSDQTFDEAAELDGWTMNEEVMATFRPVEAGWRATVHHRVVYGRSFKRFHFAVVDPFGRCMDVTLRSRLTDARIYAEGRVRWLNRPKAA
jgi:hypothetical protein